MSDEPSKKGRKLTKRPLESVLPANPGSLPPGMAERALTALTDPLAILDTDLRIAWANEARVRLHKRSLAEMTGCFCYEVFHKRAAFCEWCPVTETLLTGEPCTRERFIDQPDGMRLWFETHGWPILDGKGRITHVVEYEQDVTHLKQADGKSRALKDMIETKVSERTVQLTEAHDQLKTETDKLRREGEALLRTEKLKALGVLAGGIAYVFHDFNNLLTGILGNISLAKMDQDLGIEVIHILSNAEKAALRLKHLTGQLAAFSKSEAPIKEAVSVQTLLEDITLLALKRSNVTCDFSISDRLWPVNADKTQISQVINNLVINARQAMPAGGTIKVQADNITFFGDARNSLPLNEGRYVHISIEDHGIGILEGDLEKIFDPCFSTKEKGRGLGLAVAHSIIQKHSGYIDVESRLGAGTTFHVYLPAAEPATESKERNHTPAGKGKILIMDDEEIIRDVAGKMLTHLGCTVEFAKDGDKAVELYKKAKESGQPFNAVILDLLVHGGMGGAEAIKKLIEIDPEVKGIVSSGYYSEPIMAEYKKYGFHGALPKPYKLEELAMILRKVIGSS